MTNDKLTKTLTPSPSPSGRGGRYPLLSVLKKMGEGLAVLLFAVSFSFAEVKGTTDDPLVIGGGARPIGMGRAFTAISDDCDGILINPAGIASLKGPQVMSMMTNLLEDIYYSEYCAVIPANFGTVGVGYINTGIKGIPVGSPEVLTDYYDSLLVLGYSSPLNRYLQYANNVYVGGTIKIFNRGYSTGILTSTGYSGDLGVKFIPSPYLLIGVVRQNILPVSMGSVLELSSGAEEAFAGVTKFGIAIKPIPMKGKLILAFDTDFPTQSSWPMTSHIGVEWKITDNYAIRAGLDQSVDVSTFTKASWNPSFGTSLSYANFRIDYAYHSFYNQPELATNYISMSYSGEPAFALKGRAE